VIRLACLPLILLVLTGACVSSHESYEVRELRIEPGVTTKEELIQELGAPRGMRLQGDDTVLVFSYTDLNGSGYGLGFYIISIGVESTHAGVDNLEVVIGPDRVVRSFRLAQVPREHPKWPSDN